MIDRPLRFMLPAALLLGAAGCSTAPEQSTARLCEGAIVADCVASTRTTRAVVPAEPERLPGRDIRNAHPGRFALGAAIMMF
jgi:hypothetical protein